ncbi:hypothetical protein FOZ62_006645 [Perkinsus olseni]|uniref:Uncharacterized protein n=2 Tax=Perkinsus olseni TaxID=32597 RepID=A0A7J6S737_PEROL|nr:hypothetical protein FOZ62_006645 [Perkinsus olseni]
MAVQLGSSSRASLIHPDSSTLNGIDRLNISLCLVSSPAEHIVDKIGWIEANLDPGVQLGYSVGQACLIDASDRSPAGSCSYNHFCGSRFSKLAGTFPFRSSL